MAKKGNNMDRESKRFVAIELLLIGTLLVAFLAGNGFADLQEQLLEREAKNYTVKEVLDKKPLGREVIVYGQLRRKLKDYQSDSGNIYQQFYIASGGSEVLVFCSTSGGRFNTSQVEAGDKLKVSGEFKKYYGQLEIYTSCSTISTKN